MAIRIADCPVVDLAARNVLLIQHSNENRAVPAHRRATWRSPTRADPRRNRSASAIESANGPARDQSFFCVTAYARAATRRWALAQQGRHQHGGKARYEHWQHRHIGALRRQQILLSECPSQGMPTCREAQGQAELRAKRAWGAKIPPGVPAAYDTVPSPKRSKKPTEARRGSPPRRASAG
jgi:hypothetical protein